MTTLTAEEAIRRRYLDALAAYERAKAAYLAPGRASDSIIAGFLAACSEREAAFDAYQHALGQAGGVGECAAAPA